MEKKKAYEQPESGIFYMVPNPKALKYEIVSEIEESGKDSLHLYLWGRVMNHLKANFKRTAGLNSLDESYMGLPRGRVIAPADIHGDWILAHGNDFPLKDYKDDILSIFNLRDAEGINKLKVTTDPHEAMIKKDKAEVEQILNIKMDKTGFKLV